MTTDKFNSRAEPQSLQRELFEAIARNDLPTVDRLCYNDFVELDCRNADGRQPHVFAASIGHTGLMHYIAQAGVTRPTSGFDVNARDRDGMTALMHCMARGDEDGGKILVGHFGARVSYKNKEGQTARRLAELSGKDSFAASLRHLEKREKGNRLQP